MSNMARSTEIDISDGDFERIVRTAAPPTRDDGTITSDGRRVDTPEKLHGWLDELAEQRELDESSDLSV